MKNRFLSLSAAAILAFSAIMPSVSAGFETFYSSSPDFFISTVSQDLDTYTYNARVCNSGATPSKAGTLRISIERSGKSSESRTFSDVAIANGKCQDFQVEGIYTFGKYDERNYPLYVVATWKGDRADRDSSNDRKLFPAKAGASGQISASSKTSTTTRKDPLADLWKTSDASQKYRYTSTNVGGNWSSYSWYVPTNKYVPGTSGYYASYTSSNNWTYGGSDRPNFFPVRIVMDGSQKYIMATYCNDGFDMGSFQDVRIRFENKMSATKADYTEYIKLLSGQCRDITVPLTSLAVKYRGNYTFSVKIDSEDRIWERSESDNSLTADVYVNYSDSNSCYYNSYGYYTDERGNRYTDSECRYGSDGYVNSCTYQDGYYSQNGFRYTDSNCRNAYYYNDSTNNNGYYNTTTTNNNNGYYYNGSRPTQNSDDGYYYNGNWYYNGGVNFSGNYNTSICTYTNGSYYLNGYRYTDSNCQYRTDGYNNQYNGGTYYNGGYYGCTYQDGYYFANGNWYTDASCTRRR